MKNALSNGFGKKTWAFFFFKSNWPGARSVSAEECV